MKTMRNKAVSFFILLHVAIYSFAVDIYLSPATGSDSNDGSSNSPVATLTKAYSLITDNTSGKPANNIIHVSGFIDITKEAAQPVNLGAKKYCIIQGDDPATDGFDGKESVALITLAGNYGAITFKNLTFKNASANYGAVAQIINAGIFVFDHCKFHDNKTNGNANSGNLHIFTANATFTDCEFYKNEGTRGGVIWMYTSAVASIKNCHFHDNNVTTGYSGSAIFQNGTAINSIENSVFESHNKGNYVIENAGAKLSLLNCTIQNNQAGGINSTNTSGELDVRGCLFKENSSTQAGTGINSANQINYIEGSAIIGNKSTAQGAGLYLTLQNGNSSFKMINTTVANNITENTYGGGIFVAGTENLTNELYFVNVTLTGNKSQSTNWGGGGIFINSEGNLLNKIYVYNSIFEGNPNQVRSTDLYVNASKNTNAQPEEQGQILIKNSIIEVLYGENNTTTGASIINPADVIHSAVGGRGFGIVGQPYMASGLAKPYTHYLTSQNSLPLDFDAEALEFGDAQYLQALNINTDQLGNIRPFRDGKCAAGAIEVPAELIVADPEGIDYQHFIIYGQSLSVGYQAYQSLSLANVEGNYMLGEQVWLNLGNTDINQLKPLVATSAIGSAAIAECPITAAVNHIRKKQQVDRPAISNRFIATSVGMGGKIVAELSKSNASNLYTTYSSALKAAYGTTKRSGSTIHCPAIVWMQGEDDYTREASPTKAQYLSDLLQLKNDMQNDAVAKYVQADKPSFYTYQCGAQYTRGRELNVGMAQLEASNQNADIFCVGPVYPMTDVGGHLDANGYRWYGEMIGKVYHKTRVLGQDFKPLQPKKILRDAFDPKKVIVRFLVPTLPLVLDTHTLKAVNDYGFEVYNNNARQTITSVTIQGSSVVIACAAELTGKIEVVYAGVNTTSAGSNGRGHGNLRDSDAEKGFFNYIDPNLKNEGTDIYTYPHYDALASYTPASGEPTDEEGHVMYDQPYPLYNFSVAFYYAIPAGANEYEVPELRDNLSAIAFTAVQTGGVSGVSNSTGITLTFDRPIEDLKTEHIRIENGTGTVITGNVSGSGTTYSIALTDVTKEGDIRILVNHPDYDIANNPQPVAVVTRLHAVTLESIGTKASGGGNYPADEPVSIDAGTAPADYRFTHWTANPSVSFARATDAVTTFPMLAVPVTVTAHFARLYAVNIAASEHGQVTVESTPAIAGERVTLHIASDEGYRLSALQVSRTEAPPTAVAVVGQGETRTFVMPAGAVTVTATFAPLYAVNIPAFVNGKVTADPASAVAGETVTLHLAPDNGYEPEEIGVRLSAAPQTPVAVSGAGSTRTFVMPEGAVRVTASFRKTADLLSLEAAVQSIEATALVATQEEVSSQEEALTWLLNTLNERIRSTAIVVPERNIYLYNFSKAIAGTQEQPAGRNGSFAATVSLSKNGNYATLSVYATITATPYSPVGIDAASAGRPRAAVQDGVLRLTGLAAGDTWSVYTLSGVPMHRAIATGTEASVALPVRGVYLVRIQTVSGVQSQKIIR